MTSENITLAELGLYLNVFLMLAIKKYAVFLLFLLQKYFQSFLFLLSVLKGVANHKHTAGVRPRY